MFTYNLLVTSGNALLSHSIARDAVHNFGIHSANCSLIQLSANLKDVSVLSVYVILDGPTTQVALDSKYGKSFRRVEGASCQDGGFSSVPLPQAHGKVRRVLFAMTCTPRHRTFTARGSLFGFFANLPSESAVKVRCTDVFKRVCIYAFFPFHAQRSS